MWDYYRIIRPKMVDFYGNFDYDCYIETYVHIKVKAEPERNIWSRCSLTELKMRTVM
ncbi:hypothetical protein KSF_022320 [Reticulibacter mediterranei]|uniref:Uncharacterized protein n=1 Tax=Reticulibacter mediterranei TaxID=2778369 RepID=A0A8J3MYL5_9CHLR|nr:hypothetical protein KSF_022320 [Reticulibacter mediterranei]